MHTIYTSAAQASGISVVCHIWKFFLPTAYKMNCCWMLFDWPSCVAGYLYIDPQVCTMLRYLTLSLPLLFVIIMY